MARRPKRIIDEDRMDDIEKEVLNHRSGIIGQVIAPLLGEAGFVLLLFDFGRKGNMAYLSNAEREDAIQLLKEAIKHMEEGNGDGTATNAGSTNTIQ